MSPPTTLTPEARPITPPALSPIREDPGNIVDHSKFGNAIMDSFRRLGVDPENPMYNQLLLVERSLHAKGRGKDYRIGPDDSRAEIIRKTNKQMSLENDIRLSKQMKEKMRHKLRVNDIEGFEVIDELKPSSIIKSKSGDFEDYLDIEPPRITKRLRKKPPKSSYEDEDFVDIQLPSSTSNVDTSFSSWEPEIPRRKRGKKKKTIKVGVPVDPKVAAMSSVIDQLKIEAT